MSFGYSVSDALALTSLAWNTVQNSRKACGEHDGLTREVSALHVVLRRLKSELKKPESPINVGPPDDTYKQELRNTMADCGRVLHVLDKILEKYNALGEEEKTMRRLWQQFRFGNGEMASLGDLRNKVVLYTSTITLSLNMISMGSVGRIEQEMSKSGGVLRDIQLAVSNITSQFISNNRHEDSVFTSYADDDKLVWREFRRELRHDGFTSDVLHKHKHLILDYIKELGSRGLLDDQDPNVNGAQDWLDFDTIAFEPASTKDTIPSKVYTSTPAHFLSPALSSGDLGDSQLGFAHRQSSNERNTLNSGSSNALIVGDETVEEATTSDSQRVLDSHSLDAARWDHAPSVEIGRPKTTNKDRRGDEQKERRYQQVEAELASEEGIKECEGVTNEGKESEDPREMDSKEKSALVGYTNAAMSADKHNAQVVDRESITSAVPDGLERPMGKAKFLVDPMGNIQLAEAVRSNVESNNLEKCTVTDDAREEHSTKPSSKDDPDCKRTNDEIEASDREHRRRKRWKHKGGTQAVRHRKDHSSVLRVVVPVAMMFFTYKALND